MSYSKYGLLFTLFFYAASQGFAFSQVVEVVSPPVLHPVTNAALPRTPYAWRSNAGAFGESFATETLKLRGFQDIREIKLPGGQGIDRIAVKRGPAGEILDARFVEVKTNYGRPPKLGVTKGTGEQMSRSWLAEHLNSMRKSGDPRLKSLAAELMRFRKESQIPIERLGELHHIDLKTGRYTACRPARTDAVPAKMPQKGPVHRLHPATQLFCCKKVLHPEGTELFVKPESADRPQADFRLCFRPDRDMISAVSEFLDFRQRTANGESGEFHEASLNLTE